MSSHGDREAEVRVRVEEAVDLDVVFELPWYGFSSVSFIQKRSPLSTEARCLEVS